ncbi:hypothetical protein BGZ54_008577 [Gamsiella multidivaricata]|nr:hypothetical protein BGZ54_008577 [Gamsiella multidivaricata]
MQTLESTSSSTRLARRTQRPSPTYGTNDKRQDSTQHQQTRSATYNGSLAQESAAESLAERVYSWSINELDYRPHGNGTKPRSQARTLLHVAHPKDEEKFCPQALESLCNGPCAPMFKYLIENVRSRSAINTSDRGKSDRTQRMARQGTPRHVERQVKLLQCRDLTLAIVQKQREIAETKERIKQRRQLQSIKKIHHQQSEHSIHVLQEYQGRFQQLSHVTAGSRPFSHKEDDTKHYMLKTTLEKAIGEVLRIIKMVAIDGTTLSPGQVAGSARVQDFYNILQKTNDGAKYFLGIMNDLKQNSLLLLQSARQEQSGQAQQREMTSESADLLQLFRNHHTERIVEIESVLNTIADYEQERGELYSRMRFQAQRWEQEKRQAPFLQELEESKAQLRGLGTALEFIQAEQENLVERVISVDEQHSVLEGMTKAARAADQKMIHTQRLVQKLIEMVKINQRNVPQTAHDIAGEIFRPIHHGLEQLASFAEDQTCTMENDAKIFHDLTAQSQQTYAETHTRVLQAPSTTLFNWQQELGTSKQRQGVGSEVWREITAASALSADQYILQLIGVQRQAAVQHLSIAKAKEVNDRLEQTKSDTICTMKAFVKTLPEESQVYEEDKDVGVEALSSKFECDARAIARSVVNFEKSHHSAFQSDLNDITAGAEAGEVVIQRVLSLKEDHSRIRERLTITKKASILPLSKRMRYVQ